MNFLKKQDGIQEGLKDTLGTGFVWDSGVVPVKINYAYLGSASASAAVSVNFEFENEEGKKLKYTTWVTNKEGNNYYVDKQTSQPKYLPGFELVDDIAKVALGKEISEVEKGTATLNIYNSEIKKEVPTEVQIFEELAGAELLLGVIKVQKFKQVRNDATGAYEDTAEIKNTNDIKRVFHTSGLTSIEMESGATEPEFITSYMEAYPVTYVQDKTKGKTPAAGGNAGGQAKKEPTKSLFGKK